MIQNILQGAATLSVAILVTDAVKETATSGPHVVRKWVAVAVMLVLILLLIQWAKPLLPHEQAQAVAKNIAVS